MDFNPEGHLLRPVLPPSVKRGLAEICQVFFSDFNISSKSDAANFKTLTTITRIFLEVSLIITPFLRKCQRFNDIGPFSR
jgi:hypothetical protein